MKKDKLWMILIPIIIIALILGGGYVYLKLNSAPQKVFKTAISKTFEAFEKEQSDYKTLKGTYNISANIETEDEEIQEIADYLNESNIALNIEMDMDNMLINENIKVEHQEESLIDANILLQDERVYLYLKDWFGKYIELPSEDVDFTELTEIITKTIDTKNIIASLKNELINEVSRQKFTQSKAKIMLDGTETNVMESKLNFTEKTFAIFAKELLQNLNNNNDFLIALGRYKDDVVEVITNNIAEFEKMEENADDEEHILEISIYTKGLLNKFTGVSFKLIDAYGEETIDILKHNENKYEIACYKIYEGEKENILNILLENKKQSENKGTLVVIINSDDETQEFICEYEKQDNGTYFTVKTAIKGKELIITGNIIEKGLIYQGKMAFIVDDNGTKITLNYEYSFELNADIKKIDVENSVLLNEMTEEEQEELATNIGKTELYQMIENYMVRILEERQKRQEKLEEEMEKFQKAEQDLTMFLDNELQRLGIEQTEKQDNLPIVTDGKYIVKYIVPEKFNALTYNTEDNKAYIDSEYNKVNVYIINQTAQKYFKGLNNESILKSNIYKNQQITDIQSYTVNGIEYKYRAITYNEGALSGANLYFVYELDENTCFIVEVEALGDSMQSEDMNQFLQISL